jgi:hypothetical protein
MKKIILILVIFLASTEIFSQGCSSAGFCTMGALKADQKFSLYKKVKLNYIELSQLIAFSGFGETINATTLDVSVSLGAKNKFQVRVPYVWVNGPLANTKSVGDVYLTYTRNLVSKKEYSINAMIGTKFPRFTTALATPEGKPLPLYYSPSLGTYDLVLGASFINEKWLLGVGFQQAIANTTVDNGFNPLAWESTPLFSQAQKYDASKNLKRGADVMLRIERNFRFGRYSFHTGLMPVYRLNPDEITDANNQRVQVAGSDGLALTGIIGGRYSLDAHSSIKVFYGYSLIARKAIPDGLMKTSVATLAYEWQF